MANEASNATSAYGLGVATMQQFLAQQNAQSTNDYLASQGSPQTVGSGNLGAAIAGQGMFGAQAQAGQEAAYGSFLNMAPQFTQQQLAFNAAQNSAAMAHQSAMSAISNSGGGSSGGSDGGMTANQAARLEFDMAKWEYEMQRDATEDDLEWAKFAYEQDKDQAEAQGNALMMTIAAEMLGVELPKGALAALSGGGGGSLSSLTSLVGAVDEEADETADDAADVADTRRERREDLKALISFDGIADGLNKNQVQAKIMSEISNQFPNFVGMGRAKVKNMVANYVNSGWANYKAGADTDTTTGSTHDYGGTIKSAYKDYIGSIPDIKDPVSGDSVPGKASYKTAFAQIMASVRSDWEGKWNAKTRRAVAKKIHIFLKPRIKRTPRPPRPPIHAGL